MPSYPKVDLSFDRLNRDGWAMGDIPVDRPEGRVWIVTCSAQTLDYCPGSVCKRQPGGLPGDRLASWKSNVPAAASASTPALRIGPSSTSASRVPAPGVCPAAALSVPRSCTCAKKPTLVFERGLWVVSVRSAFYC